MKIGVKTFYDSELLEKFKDKCDFFEIMALRNKDYSFLKYFSKPMVIHAEHHIFGSNPADKTKFETNLESLNVAIDLANKHNSHKIIYHAGRLDKNSSNTSAKNSINFLTIVNDKRILLENLTLQRGYYLCSHPGQMKHFIKSTTSGFCLDLNHAIESADYLKKDYVSFIKEFLKLNPRHYHLGGQNIKNKKTHLPLKDSDIDLREILRLLPKNAEVTLETDKNIENIHEDLELIKTMIN
ncbi:MAG: TIM barrel protein [Candidatus Nanoarchaeia archaeon]